MAQIGSALGKLVDCTSLSATFPQREAKEISRDAILNLIDDFFGGDIQLLLLDGRADIGKTHINMQFALRHPREAITIFVRPNGLITRDPQILVADLASQMHWALQKTELLDPYSSNESTVRRLSFELQRQSQRTGTKYYLIVDGMEDLIDEASQFTSALVSMMPFEFSGFRFLLTGDSNWIPKVILSKIRCKTYTVPGVSIDEAASYFEGFGLSRTDVEEICRSCSRGTPGYLASVRRSLESGLSASELMERLPDLVPSPFQLEWNRVDLGDERLTLALAILANDSNSHSVGELAELANASACELRGALIKCSFVDVPPDDVQGVSFVSSSFRTFASNKLLSRRSDVWDKLAAFFLNNQTSPRAMQLLPIYLDKADRKHEVLELLNSTAFMRLAERVDSVLPLVQSSNVGLTTALSLRSPADALRFGMQTAAMATVSSARVAQSEVIAKLAVDDYAAAIALAQSAALKRNRLQLLAAIARYQRENGMMPEAALLDSLSSLVEQVDVHEFGDDLVNVAGDLMYAIPELALSFISKVVPKSSDDRTLDWALAQLSVVADVQQRKGGAGMSTAAETLRSKISDPAAKRFSEASALLVGNYSPSEVLQHVEDLDNAGDRIFLLRLWCANTRKPEDAADIVNYAVHLAIRTTEYTPTARDFRDFAMPLPSITDVSKLSTFITAFDIQREAARRVGPTQDYVQLQLLLGEAETRLSPIRAGQRLVETYHEVRALADEEVRSVCMAMIVAAMARIDPTGAFELTEDARDVVRIEFDTEIRKLLDATAEHDRIAHGITDAVATSNPQLAREVIQLINTEPRRDFALGYLVQCVLQQRFARIPMGFLASLLGASSDPDNEDEIVDRVLSRARTVSSKTLNPAADDLLKFVLRACSIVNPIDACSALSASLVILTKLGRESSLRDRVRHTLHERWQEIDDPGDRIVAGYDIVIKLADHLRDVAKEYLTATDELKQSYDDLSGLTFRHCLLLAIRAFSGLLPNRLDGDADLERLGVQIDRISSHRYRSQLWTNVALRCIGHNRTDDAKRIVVTKLRPLLDYLKHSSKYEWTQAAVYAAPAIYEANPAVGVDFVLTLPEYWRDTAFDYVLRFKLTSCPPGEPFDAGEVEAYQLSLDRCLEIVKMLRFVESDSTIYRYIEGVANSAMWKRNHHSIAQTQKNEIADAISQLSSLKFPNPKFIRHDGYRVLGEAQALRLLREKTVDWGPLIKRARDLDNVSDRVFVIANLAQCLHSGFYPEKVSLLREACDGTDKIPSLIDRCNRLRMIADIARDIDKAFSKSVIVAAAELVKSGEDDDLDLARRKLVDLAYQIEPDLASSLASSFDSDESRRAAREAIEFQKLKSKLRDRGCLEGPDEIPPEDVARAAWDLLGNLNSGRAQPHDVNQTLDLLQQASRYPLRYAYPVLSLVIENAIIKRGHAEEAKRLLRDMFEATLTAGEITAAVVSAAAGKATSVVAKASSTGKTSSFLVRAGERGKALEFLQGWVRLRGTEYLMICDPYFGPRDLEAIQLIQSVSPMLTITVVTSLKQQRKEAVEWPLAEYYQSFWKRHFSEQEPPHTELVVVGGKSGDLPVHDRWWLTKDSGLRMGTSFNSIGINKDSEISELTAFEVDDRLHQTQEFISRIKREHLGEKLSYQFFEL